MFSTRILGLKTYSRGRQSFDWLMTRAESGTQSNPVAVRRGLLEDMRPKPFQDGEWLSLASCFVFRRSGVQTKRDHFVYSCGRDLLIERLTEFSRLSDELAKEAFAGTSARPWNVARAQPIVEDLVRRISYRPFDVRWLYNHPRFIDRPRPELQEVWGANNVCLYALPGGTGAGPAVWCYGLLPDYHAFRGSYGGTPFHYMTDDRT
jgi:type ISP restriction-modification system protein